jgi:hypothetical protein
MNQEISENTLKTAHQALIAELARREEEAVELQRRVTLNPTDGGWARFLSANQVIIGNIKPAIEEINHTLFGQTWDEVAQ